MGRRDEANDHFPQFLRTRLKRQRLANTDLYGRFWKLSWRQSFDLYFLNDYPDSTFCDVITFYSDVNLAGCR